MSSITGTIHTPVWVIALFWLFVPLMVPGILLFLLIALAAWLSHAWVGGCLALLVALLMGYLLARQVRAFLTLHWRVDVTLEGVEVHRGKGDSRFTPWSQFGLVRDPWPWVRRYYDLDGNEIVSFCNSPRNGHLIDGWLLGAIFTNCTQILKRELAPSEATFIMSRWALGLCASEMVRDRIRSSRSKPEELERYLRSESDP